MKNTSEKIVPLTALAILLVAASPLAYASTLTVNLNPKTGLAKVDSVSTTKIVFTYPANSTISKYMRNVSSSLTLKGTFAGTSLGAHELQGAFDEWPGHASVSNMSVSLSYNAKGNTTALVVDKSTAINATVTGIFHVVNGTVHADLGWRAFVITGAMTLPLEGHMVEANLAGPAVEESVGGQGFVGPWMVGAFGGGAFWNRPTLNFSALNTPLTTWTKNYDKATNTTTFSKTISGSSTFDASFTYNTQKYTLSMVSDPSGVVTVQGYANAEGDSLVMAPAPASTAAGLLAFGAAVAVLIGIAGYLVVKRGIRPKTSLAN